jgi:hypothetical protein
MPTVISVSIWLPVSSVLSTCYCLDRHCVLKSLVIRVRWNNKQCFQSMHTCLLRETPCFGRPVSGQEECEVPVACWDVSGGHKLGYCAEGSLT